ncbi:hypothetical protein [Pseudobacter ginsenosidimutans]|uniref:GLPGLI family protein n=1 Tax=Pseudobacter ginsenosidimutans TaxID=661488 RepID=A0A4Q7N116_9BACT|nr:hypothetical protein [Pseudobacter ginsenosidimutans]QEC42900.1 hypothetical protein FSB84_14850 [Pseudobacter ginsenosidimutans]RZS74254.1 hypothetical protein EV199_0098 [Pseudobacter ginsenosidimutans]
MKQPILLIILAVLTTGTIHAQIPPAMERPVKKPVLRPVPPPPAQKPVQPAPAPAPAQKTEPAVTAPVYKLSSAKVIIQTGSDNKEFPSIITISVRTLNTKQGLYLLPGNGLTNEFKVNSTTEIGLVQSNGVTAEARDKIQKALTLDYIQQSGGLNLRIYYGPNFFMDAWKIEGVKLVMEFRDQYGNLHPVYGNKTITFNTASGFLNNTYKTMECLSDPQFNPTTSPISEYGKF